jgi:hypothetical protein
MGFATTANKQLTMEAAPFALARFLHDPVLEGAWRDRRNGSGAKHRGSGAYHLAEEECGRGRLEACVRWIFRMAKMCRMRRYSDGRQPEGSEAGRRSVISPGAENSPRLD